MMPEGQAVLCLEPRIAGSRHSGGFFYNDCLTAAARTWSGTRLPHQVTGQPSFSLQAWDGGSLPPAFVLLDSLWWYIHKRPLDILSAALAGRSWGIIMHGLPEDASRLLGDMGKASFVVVPSCWAAGQLGSVRSSGTARGDLDVRVLYPGWDGRLGLVPGPTRPGNPGDESPGDTGDTGDNPPVRIASSSHWIRPKGLVEAARALGKLSRNPACPPWLWKAAGTPDPVLIAEACSSLGSLAGRLHALGHLEPAAMVRLLHDSDLFLHPSTQETFCLSVYEAALAGCRIVARAIGGVPEAIQLARLLRSQLGLPPAGVHLAPAAPDSLYPALEEALAAAVQPSVSGENIGMPASAVLEAGLLQEFSWQGRLEKLLLGQSDRPLPPLSQLEQTEVS